MEGIERAGAGGGSEHTGLPLDSEKAQAALVLAAYRMKHEEITVPINTADPEKNEEDLQNAAMLEWIGDVNNAKDMKSMRAQYRAYAEKYPHKLVNTSDRESLEELVNDIRAWNVTLH